MGITLEFKDYEEMIAFAKVLLAGTNLGEPKKTDAKQETKIETPVKEEVIENTKRAEELPLEEKTEKEYTLEEVRAALAELTRNGKQKQVKELLTSFGAKNLSGLDSKDYAAVMEKAGAL